MHTGVAAAQGAGFANFAVKDGVKDYYNNGSHSAEANYYAVPKSEKIGGGYYEPVYENVWVVDSPGHWE